MKFKSFTSRSPLATGEVRVESMGRIGNYFFAAGWFEGFESKDGHFEYRFADQPKGVAPEHAFHRGGEGGSRRSRFLHLFWINGGHMLEVRTDSPVVVALRDDRKGSAEPACSVHELLDGDFEAFLSALESVGSREVWGNRIVIEMVKHCGSDERRRYFQTALERVGWHQLDGMVDKFLALKSGENTVREYLDFQCNCMATMDVRLLPAELRVKFLELVDSLEVSGGDLHLVRDVIRQLARFDSGRACEFAHSAITTVPHDREQLAAVLLHCFPQDSQWWIHHALMNPALGDDQVADALNCAGTAAAAQGSTALAKLCLEAALMVSPDASSAAWNAGWFRAGLGDIETAAGFFKRVGRNYTHTSLSTCWPQAGGLPWPSLPAANGAFSLPAGVSAWPRITVVTPSFNQGGFIEDTLLSVLNQGYPNLQYIVVDGNSTDDTREVLERYRNRLDHLIIEPDNGQTEAINKGLRLADGELVAWMNSDDMYAPGALHQAALKWLENRADVIAGICIEHVERRIQLFNRPAGTNTDFNLPQLARIFRYWLKGYYFYQPEVFFSKRILDKAGLLDESLYYSMDYDLWMRFAKAGATLDVVDWPFAFFRKHEAQKTSEMIHSVEEQSRVRDQYITLGPDELRTSRLMRMLEELRRKERPVVAVCSSQLGIHVSVEALREATRSCGIIVIEDPSAPELAVADVVLLLGRGAADLQLLDGVRKAAPELTVAGWLLGHHEDMFGSHEMAESVDFLFPAHPSYERYLRNDQAMAFDAVPPAVMRWSGALAKEWFTAANKQTRSTDLHGEFATLSPDDTRMNLFLEKLVPLLEREGIRQAFGLSTVRHADPCGREAFERRCGHAASLVLPSRRETPPEVFEALLAGQIPLVPTECADLDKVVSPELQATLPILRFSLSDPSGVANACRRAAEFHGKEGAEGAVRRHQHALQHHLFSARLASMLKSMGLS